MKTWQGVVLGLALLALLPPAHSLGAVPDDAYWDDRFAPLGVDGLVYAIAVSGDAVYVGGAFTAAGGIAANGIAKWDSLTNTWSALGNGFDTTVTALTFSNGNLYAGGTAKTWNTPLAARWDGCMWSPLGSGVNNSVSGIAASGDDVYIVGSFTIAGKPSTHIGHWNKPTAPPECRIYYFPFVTK